MSFIAISSEIQIRNKVIPRRTNQSILSVRVVAEAFLQVNWNLASDSKMSLYLSTAWK